MCFIDTSLGRRGFRSCARQTHWGVTQPTLSLPLSFTCAIAGMAWLLGLLGLPPHVRHELAHRQCRGYADRNVTRPSGTESVVTPSHIAAVAHSDNSTQGTCNGKWPNLTDPEEHGTFATSETYVPVN
jgi:hypothetical protein